MKRIILLILFAAAFTLAKAQQFVPVNPELKLTDSLKSSFKPDTYSSPKFLLLQPAQQSNSAVLANNNTGVVYSRMPVVKLPSNDRMPIAEIGKLDNHDNMPVAKITVIDPLAKNETPIP